MHALFLHGLTVCEHKLKYLPFPLKLRSLCSSVTLIRAYLNISDSSVSSRATFLTVLASEADEKRVTSPFEEDSDSNSTPEIKSFDIFKGYRLEGANNMFTISPTLHLKYWPATKHGKGNPSIMDNPFWKFQVGPEGLDAWKAREVLNDPFIKVVDPVWCFHRTGATVNQLPDGRIVHIGGEHRDSNDPEFCIYNGKCSHKPVPSMKGAQPTLYYHLLAWRHHHLCQPDVLTVRAYQM